MFQKHGIVAADLPWEVVWRGFLVCPGAMQPALPQNVGGFRALRMALSVDLDRCHALLIGEDSGIYLDPGGGRLSGIC